MADRKRVSYIFSFSARRDLRWLAGENKRSMTKELEFLIQQAADAEREAIEAERHPDWRDTITPVPPRVAIPVAARHIDTLRTLARLDGREVVDLYTGESDGEPDLHDMLDTALNFVWKYYYTESDLGEPISRKQVRPALTSPESPSTPPAAQPQPPTLKDGHNYDSLSYSAKHRASQARAARDAARAVKVKAAKEREDAYANAPKDWTSDPS